VRAVVHPDVRAASAAVAWELYIDDWDQTGDVPPAVVEALRDAAVVVVGPGHRSMDVDVVQAIAAATEGTVVLDAGALEAVPEVVGRELILAPNEPEAHELTGDEGRSDRGALALAVAALTDRPAAVRGATTVVAAAGRTWESEPPPEGLGTPVSGDVFIGVLAGLLAAGNDPAGALAWATALHADAGADAGESGRGYLASEVLAALPLALAERLAPRSVTPASGG